MEMLLAQTSRKIGYTLRYYRQARGLSQMDVAHNAGMSFRNYQRLENGEVLPRVDTLLRLSLELQLPPSTLLECLEKEAIGLVEDFTDSDLGLFEILKNRAQKSDLASAETPSPKNEVPIPDDFYSLELHGNLAVLEERLQMRLQLPQPLINVEDYLVGLKPVDIWEYVSRKKLRNLKLISLILTPTGFHFFESYHYIHSWSPDSPRSLCLARDCSHRQEMKNWVTTRHQAGATFPNAVMLDRE